MSSAAYVTLQISGLAHNLANRLQTVTVNGVTFIPVDICHVMFLRGQSLDRSFSCYTLRTFTIVLIFLIFIYLRMILIYSPSGLTRM